eukprot:EG_transcript_31301
MSDPHFEAATVGGIAACAKEACDSCGGSGWVDCACSQCQAGHPPTEVCPECGGEGDCEESWTEPVECDKCYGRGWWAESVVHDECEEAQEAVFCSECWGTPCTLERRINLCRRCTGRRWVCGSCLGHSTVAQRCTKCSPVTGKPAFRRRHAERVAQPPVSRDSS